MEELISMVDKIDITLPQSIVCLGILLFIGLILHGILS